MKSTAEKVNGLDVIMISDQPTTCPECGTRTMPQDPTVYELELPIVEVCPNPNCQYIFLSVDKPTEYIAYLYDSEGQCVTQTGIDENSMELAKELFTEYGYDLYKYNIVIQPDWM